MEHWWNGTDRGNGMVLTGGMEWSSGGMVLTGGMEWSSDGMVLTGGMVWSIGGMVLTKGNKSTRRKTCGSASLSTINPT
jgi:hypothetical protein